MVHASPFEHPENLRKPTGELHSFEGTILRKLFSWDRSLMTLSSPGSTGEILAAQEMPESFWQSFFTCPCRPLENIDFSCSLFELPTPHDIWHIKQKKT